MSYLNDIINSVTQRDSVEREFHQAVRHVLGSLHPVLDRHPEYEQHRILERLTEAERIIIFRVPWHDDKGRAHVNRGFRIEMNSALGPYKGGLRFRPNVNLSILKFLAFEQTFKNALTTLPMGGGKGGSDFDPKGRSRNEVMHFCQSFMTELYRHIGPSRDVPAGDIGVGAREIGFLFGQYKRIQNEFCGALTGKSPDWGGSLIRPEATGYGVAYFAREMLKTRDESLDGKVCTVSGSGNAAQYTTEKLIELGAKVVSLSDSNGCIYDKAGIDTDKLNYVMELKNVKRGRIKEYAEKFPGVEYRERTRPWYIKCDCAFPCATENELNGADATTLVANGCFLVAEGANMPTDDDGIDVFHESNVLYGPGKAANAGGVAVSGLEMAQNAQHLSWPREEVDDRLQQIMRAIHKLAWETAEDYDLKGDIMAGANIAGFVKTANAMLHQGLV